jgi:imidazolonepropionase-like amidohydrolase
MPGLIDAHWHAMLIRPNPAQAIVGDVGYNNIAAGVEATDTLMRGFTTVRDVGGPVFGLKAAIDGGLIAGPRIYPSGAMIAVTSGHGQAATLSMVFILLAHFPPTRTLVTTAIGARLIGFIRRIFDGHCAVFQKASRRQARRVSRS